MIDTYKPIRTAYYAALNGNVTVTIPGKTGSTTIDVYSQVPNTKDYPYIYIGNQSDTGGDVETRTKDNRYATEHLIELYAVTGFETANDNASRQLADDIIDEMLQIILADTPLTFTGVENVTANYEGGVEESERNETHLVITRQIVIRHTLSQN